MQVRRERVVKDRILRTRLKKEVCGRRLEKKVRDGRSKRETEKICVRERNRQREREIVCV